jgi:hypothetical protein
VDHSVKPSWQVSLPPSIRLAYNFIRLLAYKILVTSCDVGHTVCSGVPSLGRAELQAACEDFINVIGSSSDCTLYKGTLSSGVEIAVVSTSVNSVKDWTDRSEEQFKNKVITQCAKLYMVKSISFSLL